MSHTLRGYAPLKRLMDVVLGIGGLLMLAPVMALVALAIYIDDPGPVLFRQLRAGRWHRPFTIYKFRTMRQNTPNLSTEELRQQGLTPYTRLGVWLRRTSLDELPQLINVVRGEMSLVGPRPALPSQEVVLRGREQLGVEQLKPGITGLAQVTGRDDLADEEKVARDARYLQHVSFMTDILLLQYTVRSVFRARGAY